MERAPFQFKSLLQSSDTRSTASVPNPDLSPINDVHVNQYYEHVLQEIALIIAKSKFDEEMHGCRKLIKILIYNKLVRPFINPALNEDYLKEIETAIGEWHNLAMALEFYARHDIRGGTGILELKKQDRKWKTEIRKLGKDFYQRATLTKSGIK